MSTTTTMTTTTATTMMSVEADSAEIFRSRFFCIQPRCPRLSVRRGCPHPSVRIRVSASHAASSTITNDNCTLPFVSITSGEEDGNFLSLRPGCNYDSRCSSRFLHIQSVFFHLCVYAPLNLADLHIFKRFCTIGRFFKVF